MNKEDNIEIIANNIDRLSLLVRTFDFNKENDYIALEQFWNKLESSIQPLLNKDTQGGIGKGRGKRPILCVETGIEYPSAEHACLEYPISIEAVRRSCKTGVTIFKVMKTFKFADEV